MESETNAGRVRILFVDDEIKVLDGLRRMLFPMRKEWEMVFVPGAREALEALVLEPFEVIVTDMRMPGIDGAELLDEVVKLYPEMVRLVLSGQWDPGMSIRSAKTAHQYLTKPCSTQFLKATLDRIFALRRKLTGRSLKRLVSGMTTLPSLPSAYAKLLATLESPYKLAEQIGDVIASDIAMTAKVLQLANSAFFGIARRVSHPAEATRYLGVDTMKALVLTIGVFSPFRGSEPPSLPLAALQHHSLETARIAQSIAKFENAGKEIIEDSFLAGLVHDAGKLVLISKDPEMYEGVASLAQVEGLDLYEVEREAFGASHAEVGSYLLWLWGLPESVVQDVAFHHRPSEHLPQGPCAALFVHVADALTHEMAVGSRAAEALDESILCEAGYNDRLASWRSLAHNSLAARRTS